jgi:hypothetical protein
MQSAINLNEKELWTRLGQEALAQGNLKVRFYVFYFLGFHFIIIMRIGANDKVVQRAYRQTLDFERLSHLFSITGNIKNLSKMMEIATSKRAGISRRTGFCCCS